MAGSDIQKYIGIDVGGMTVKGIVIDLQGNIVAEDYVETGVADGGKTLTDNVVKLISLLAKKSGGDISCFCGVGIGCPGLIDSATGTVVFAGNLKLSQFALASAVSSALNIPVKVVNDANAAALGEAKFGAGKDYYDSVFVTLGTGVGGGIVIGGKLFEGYKSAGAELGHMVIVEGGKPCTCGRRGCFEAYSSASALIKKTREEMLANPKSKMWDSYSVETVSGKTAFEYDDDESAKKVVEWYVKYLACGLTNIANVFRPQVIMLGGGVGEQGEKLLTPVREIFERELFAGSSGYAPVRLVKATLGSKAGAYGAAALFM